MTPLAVAQRCLFSGRTGTDIAVQHRHTKRRRPSPLRRILGVVSVRGIGMLVLVGASSPSPGATIHHCGDADEPVLLCETGAGGSVEIINGSPHRWPC